VPVHTVIRPEFGVAVKEALGGMKAGEASIKTGISDVYIYKMLQGRVPSEDIIRRFAKGLDVDEGKLLIAAGYRQTTDILEAVEDAIRRTGKMTDEQIQDIKEKLKNILGQYFENHKKDKGQ
jgi:transcriptional regulator with XRE-family HTH domain